MNRRTDVLPAEQHAAEIVETFLFHCVLLNGSRYGSWDGQVIYVSTDDTPIHWNTLSYSSILSAAVRTTWKSVTSSMKTESKQRQKCPVIVCLSCTDYSLFTLVVLSLNVLVPADFCPFYLSEQTGALAWSNQSRQSSSLCIAGGSEAVAISDPSVFSNSSVLVIQYVKSRLTTVAFSSLHT